MNVPSQDSAELEGYFISGDIQARWMCVCVFGLTAQAVGVLVRSTQKVRQGHQQRSQTGQQGSSSDEPRPVDSTPKETHKDNESSVSHLDTQPTNIFFNP